MSTAQWTELEEYRRLLQDYTRRKDEYDKALKTLRQGQEAGQEDQELKTRLEKEFAELNDLYNRISDRRGSLAEARDAARAPAMAE